jgi:hypothetical protein
MPGVIRQSLSPRQGFAQSPFSWKRFKLNLNLIKFYVQLVWIQVSKFKSWPAENQKTLRFSCSFLAGMQMWIVFPADSGPAFYVDKFPAFF